MPKRLIVVTAAGIHLAGCVLGGVYFPSVPRADLRPGDHVDLYLVDGTVRRLVVTRKTAWEVCDATQCVPGSHVKWLFRRDFIR